MAVPQQVPSITLYLQAIVMLATMHNATLLLLMGSLLLLPLHSQQSSRSIDVPPGTQLLLQAKGEGVQIYTCSQTSGGLQWVLKAPDAKLLDDSGSTIGAHFAGPTWKLTDGSEVQGELIASKPAPDPHSVAWLLLRAKPGTGIGRFAPVVFIQRTETHGGIASSSSCNKPGNVGSTVRIPYSATYRFYARQ